MPIVGLVCYFFFKYAFNNPDGDFCYVDAQTGEASTEDLEGSENISTKWRYWFLFNLISIAVINLMIWYGAV